MFEYVLRLMIVIPLVGGLAWASLWMWKRAQAHLPAQFPAQGGTRIVETIGLGSSGRLVVIAFGGKTLLLAASPRQVALLAEVDDND